MRLGVWMEEKHAPIRKGPSCRPKAEGCLSKTATNHTLSLAEQARANALAEAPEANLAEQTTHTAMHAPNELGAVDIVMQQTT